ncbi:hypothetical protein FGG08_001759 [Glutinoglossum americanum]|uniref:Nucleoporin Pom152 n=1 Tax=Glutinoglossum americanum TaxID=1670608 RepID=A0A9P8L2E6_9PEZI|nr:hypothetical protein FGG08_001759 [Glutinoglossum americanum]
MNGTPRLRSAYPSTPQTGSSGGHGPVSPLRSVPTASGDQLTPGGPLIPFHLVDAPSQRFYALAVYVGLFGWRLYDWYRLVEEDGDSIAEFWNFLKWGAIDGVFLYGLPGLRIPWLEWSWTTTTTIFLVHAIMDGFLMFRFSLPLLSWLLAIVRIFYDREIAISEHRVDPNTVINNSSLILGKQTVHILPEGSAMLNPEGGCFCLDGSKKSINLPIRINQTEPILIELLRIDLDTNQNETIVIPAKQVKELKRKADKGLPKNDISSPRFLNFETKRTGIYRLQKVVDKSKLEVQRRLSDTLIVTCPKASITRSQVDKCKGELSDLSLLVEGTPPLKIKYSRIVNQKDKGFSLFQSIQPENFLSPFTGGQRASGVLASQVDTDASWARAQSINVPLNESLSTSGTWLYSLDEVHDACGNIANYTLQNDDGEKVKPKGANVEQAFVVHERPRASMSSCDPQHPLKIAKGRTALLPILLTSTGRGAADIAHTLTYMFTPQEKLQANGEHAMDAKIEEISLKSPVQGSLVKEQGLYTLKTISNQFCTGEVMEPASCQVLNPPEPDMKMEAEKIHDKCAGKPIGLTIDLDLVGTPPFDIRYEVTRSGDKHVQHKSVHITRLRHQLRFTPQEAGYYTYRFKTIDDSVYKGVPLPKDFVLESEVKPPASARLVMQSLRKKYCIEEPVSFDVRLQGEAPWTLEYELVYGGKRTKRKIKDIETELHTITTNNLVNGGEYALALASVQDKTGCKIFLEEEVKIDVRRQRPKASFGQLEGRLDTLTLEDSTVQLPLRLTGEAPWKVKYRNLNTSQPLVYEKRFSFSNDFLEVHDQGSYEIIDVQDQICPGTVDLATSTFKVLWIPRPEVKVSESVVVELAGDKYVKKQVCEGDEDTLEISLSGMPPYNLKYEQRLTPERGAVSLTNKQLTLGLGVASIRMETSQAGQYEYKFSELGDYLYDHNPKKHSPLVVQQLVNPRPSARFRDLGRTYNYCKEVESGDEVIPIMLEGVPPFYLEISIKPHTHGKPEVVSVPNINTKAYDFRIPPHILTLGHHTLSVRKVRDARGCQRKTEFDAPHVPVHVSDIPVISPFNSKTDYCVGDRIAYTLSGTPPFNVFYSFEGIESKATSTTTTFRRMAQRPGNFTITALTDNAAYCKARTQITKIIHQMPSVKVGKGKETVVDIHEGGEAELIFEFEGTPPFEFTYTRSTTPRKGQKPQILETKHDTSDEYVKVVKASDEGTYEVTAIKDRYCAFSKTLRADGGMQKQKKIKYQ